MMKYLWIYLLMALSVRAQGVDAPEVQGPVDQAESVVFCPHFSWEAPSDTNVVCGIEIAKDADFKMLVDSDSIAAMTGWYVCEKKLEPGTYYWRIRFDQGAWSEARPLTIVEPKKTLRIAMGMNAEQIGKVIQALEADPHNVKLEFEKGTYTFKPGFEKALIRLENARDVIIEGNGSTFVNLEPSSPFWKISNSTNVVISGVKYQYDPYPASYVKVLSVDGAAGTMEAEVLQGFDDTLYPREVNQMFCYAVNPENPRRLHPDRPGHTFLDPKKTTKTGDHRYRFFVRSEAEKGSLAQLQVNDRLIIPYRRWPAGLVFRCSDFSFYNVENLGAEGAVFMGGGNTDMKFIGYLSQSTHPPLPGNAWVTGNDRRGPWIENCVFETLSDDGPNITGNIYLIHKTVDECTLDLFTGPAWQDAAWRAGDHLLFWNPQTGEVVGETQVAEVVSEKLSDAFLMSCPRKTVRTTSAVKGLKPGNDLRSNTHVYNLSCQNTGFVARNNRIVDGRRFGFNVKAINSVIEKNYFEGLASCAVYIENEPTGWEGIVGRNMVIQDNVMVACGDSVDSARRRRASGVHVNLWRIPSSDGMETGWKGHENILIRRNTMVDWESVGIGVDNACNVRIEENRFENKTRTGFLIDGNCAISVGANTRDVDVENNHFSDGRRFQKIKRD